ncbi:fungal protein [Schizosaccharomyces japonicus yFS275]|uniref:Fungal protein n=1 Tax=Schizosaccharomyces japonicus (strain yFS275 / FY16936) TaxID=402676 RepID=B6JXI6_SCHJY|nr:fungal protein [Schizosaccharomyces japonicus yFS275]EEB05130.1 fungal protein [Schizosaccharomyces japonicus yFS275]
MLLPFRSVLLLYTVLLSSLAVMLLWKPEKIVDSGLVGLMGAAMEVDPLVMTKDAKPLLSFLGLVFMLLSLSYWVPLLQDNMSYFTALVPIRALFNFGLSSFIYLRKQSPLSNSLAFTFAFCDLIIHFWLFASMNDERNKLLKKKENEEKAN